MDAGGGAVSARRTFLAAGLFLALLPGCSIPKIIILHDPLSAEEHVRLGEIYEKQGKTDLAATQYREAVRRNKKHVRAWMLLGDSACRRADYAEAQDAYETALELDRGNGDLHNNLAWVYALRGRKLEKAEALVRSAMELNPANRPYYLDTLGMVLLKQGRAGDAVAALEEATATIPEKQRAMLAEAYRHLADALAAAGERERAESARREHRRLTTDGGPERSPSP